MKAAMCPSFILVPHVCAFTERLRVLELEPTRI